MAKITAQKEVDSVLVSVVKKRWFECTVKRRVVWHHTLHIASTAQNLLLRDPASSGQDNRLLISMDRRCKLVAKQALCLVTKTAFFKEKNGVLAFSLRLSHGSEMSHRRKGKQRQTKWLHSREFDPSRSWWWLQWGCSCWLLVSFVAFDYKMWVMRTNA